MLGFRLQVTGVSVSRGSFASLKGSHALHEGESRYARGEFKFPFFKIRRMSECRFIVYFEYAERRGEEDEVFNRWPKAGVV